MWKTTSSNGWEYLVMWEDLGSSSMYATVVIMVVVAVAAELMQKVLLGLRQAAVVLPLKDRVWRLRIRAWCCHEHCREEEGAAATRARRGCNNGFWRELEWWLIQARTLTTVMGTAFLTMARRKGGVPTRCEDGEIVNFSGNMMMKEERGAKKMK